MCFFVRGLLCLLVCSVCLLSGCPPAGGPSDAGPSTAGNGGANLQLVANGKNKELSYKAKQPGMLYLYDPDSNEFVFRGRVNAGEQFVFEPGSSLAMIDKQRIELEHPTNDRDEYRLYFATQ